MLISMELKSFRFKHHNTSFFGRYSIPDSCKGIIVLVHGMGEHSGRYEKNLIPAFNTAGFGVIAFDHFGHGKTIGPRGHNPGYEAVLNSVQKMIEKAKELCNDKPVFLFGHSMGGNVVINYALRRPDEINGVIASSPFLKLAFEPPAWKLTLAKLFKKIAPGIAISSGLEVEAISRDAKIVEDYKNDKLNHDKVSPNFSLVFMETGEWALKNAHRLKIPMLLLHGTADRLTNFEASKQFAGKSDKVTFKSYEGGYHELHNDLCKEEELKDLLDWLNKHI